MPAMRCLLVMFAIAAVGCPKTQDTPVENPEFEAAQPHDTPKPGPGANDPCSPVALRLPAAAALTPWKPPVGCGTRKVIGNVLIKTDAQAAKTFDCPGTKLGIDFSNTGILVSSRTLSPATVGIDALDDGKTVTLVNRFRRPCAKESRPVPVPMTFMFLITRGDRRFSDASCTVDAACP